MRNFRYFDSNEVGRDFVVGDIHGCFQRVREALRQLLFDCERDRLFSVGDLVDRGPQSQEAVEWLKLPWFHAVRGNHEQMAIDFLKHPSMFEMYCANGGGWFVTLPVQEQREIADAFEALPIAIQIGPNVGIVHAEPCGRSWQEFVKALGDGPDEHVLNNALWARSRIKAKNHLPFPGIEHIFVGHTPLDAPATLGNVHYIDTAAVFGGKLTIVQINGDSHD